MMQYEWKEKKTTLKTKKRKYKRIDNKHRESKETMSLACHYLGSQNMV